MAKARWNQLGVEQLWHTLRRVISSGPTQLNVQNQPRERGKGQLNKNDP